MKSEMPAMFKCSDIREQFISLKNNGSFADDGNLELISVCFSADEPSIFGEINHDWNNRELNWYLTESLNVNDITPPIPKIWIEVSSPAGAINSNYGWCIFSKENGNQFDNAIESLKFYKNTRMASLIYNRPSIHTDAKKDGMSDFICTYATQFIIRNNLLYHIIYMRSNDAVYGYKGDWAWQNYVHELGLNRLKEFYTELEKGPMIWNAASLHVYPRHFYLVKD